MADDYPRYYEFCGFHYGSTEAARKVHRRIGVHPRFTIITEPDTLMEEYLVEQVKLGNYRLLTTEQRRLIAASHQQELRRLEIDEARREISEFIRRADAECVGFDDGPLSIDDEGDSL